VKRQISKKSGAEYARLTLEVSTHCGSHRIPGGVGQAELVIRADGAYLFIGGYIPRDRDEEQAPFVVDAR